VAHGLPFRVCAVKGVETQWETDPPGSLVLGPVATQTVKEATTLLKLWVERVA
jgi:hypothetical protein